MKAHPHDIPTLDMRRLRGLLAEHRITHTHFADTCGLSRAFVSHLLTGQRQPGQLACIKIARAMEALGLDGEEAHHAA